jgi:transaldolase
LDFTARLNNFLKGVVNMVTVNELKVKIFADGADKAGMLEMNQKPFISGFTTNPTLMRKAGIKDYAAFAKDILKEIHDKPISFEVFSDDFEDMKRQANIIAGWGENVYVKIPVTNTKGEPALSLISSLAQEGIKLNITALMTLAQVRGVSEVVGDFAPAYISVFAGRVADTGLDPMPMMVEAIEILKAYPNQELLWASPRELLNVFQANHIGCHVITATNDILKKLEGVGKDLTQFSLETVQMFYNDATAAEFVL